MKEKYVSRFKLLFMLLPIMAVAFYVLSSITGGGAASVFTPAEIVNSICDMQEPPQSGTPLDYSPMENFRFANYIVFNSTYFESDSVGTCKADLGFTKYTQNVRNSRKVKDRIVFAETVSTSSLVSVAEQKYVTANDVVLFRPADKVHGDNITWSDTIYPMGTDTFFSKYGAVPREITKYSVTGESVSSAKLISFGNDEYVYEYELIPEIGGKYFKNEIRTLAGASKDPVIHSMTITVTMDSNWYVKTVLCVDTYDIAIPVLGSMYCVSSMLDTFSYINEDLPLPEREVFEPFLPADGEVIDPPDIPTEKNASTYLAEAFAPYLNGENLVLEADVLSAAGRHNIKASVDISAMDITALVDDALFIKYGDDRAYIGAGILKGYLPLSALSSLSSLGGDFDLSSLNIGGLDLSKLSQTDFKSMLTDDLIGSLFEGSDIEKEDGLVTITLKFKLSDLLKPDSELYDAASKVALDVDLVINDGESVSLKNIDATVKINGVPVIIEATPREGFDFPDISSFVSLEPALDFITPAINTANAESFGLVLTADIASEGFNDFVTANITLNRDLTLSGKITLEKLGIDFDVCFDGENIYVKCGKLGLKAAADEAWELKDALSPLLALANIQIPDLSALKDIDTDFDTAKLMGLLAKLDLNELFAHLSEFEAADGRLRTAVNVGGTNYGITLSHNGTYITELDIDEITAYGVTVKANISLTASESAQTVSVPSVNYIDAKDAVKFVDPITELLNKRGAVVGFKATVSPDGGESVTVTGQISAALKKDGADFQVNLSVPQADGKNIAIVFARSGGEYFLVYDSLRVSGGEKDWNAFMKIVEPMLPKFLPRLISDIERKIDDSTPELSVNSVLNMIERALVENSDTLKVELKLGTVGVNVAVKIQGGSLASIEIDTTLCDKNIGDIKLDATLTVISIMDESTAQDYALSALNLDYTPASELVEYFGALVNTFKQSAYRVTFDDIRVWYKDKTHKVNGYVEFMPTNGIPNLRLGFNVYETAATGIDADFTGIKPLHTFDIMITDGDPLQEIYLTYNGVKFKLTVEEVLNLFANVKDALNIKDGTLLDFIIPEDREVVSGEFLNDFGISELAEMSELINGLLDIATTVYYEAQEFMNDYDYDYINIVNTATDVLNSLTSLFGLQSVGAPSVGDVVELISNLPRISLNSVTSEDKATSTMTVYVNGTGFTLTRTNNDNPVLVDWGMSNLATRKLDTVTTFRLTLEIPEASEVVIDRPVYHDYNYATNAGGTYKRQELIDNILAGKFEGVSLPNYNEEYVRHDVSFEEDDIIKSQRYEYSWFRYKQNNSGDYVKLKSGSYVKKDEFITKIKDLTYVEYNGEYWTYTDFYAMKNTVNDNGSTVSLDSYFDAWFQNNYGMPYDTYYKLYLEGNCLNDLSNVSNLTTALLNTANLTDFHITGKINVTIKVVVTISVEIPIDARVKLIPTVQPDGSIVNKPLVIVSLSTPEKLINFALVKYGLDKSATQIYYLDGYMYFNKLDKNGKYNFVKIAMPELMDEMSGEDGMTNIMNYVYYVTALTSDTGKLISDQIKKNTGETPGRFEDFYKYYYFKDNRHHAKIDLASLAGNSNLSEAEVFIGTRKSDIGSGSRTFVNELGFSTTMVSVVSMKLEAVLADVGEEITTFRVATGFNGNTPIYEERSLETLKEYLDSHSYGTITNPVKE